jgi:demethylmenaquinone methyltransferase/2-methoxy-6-polyprenyl-1,4-benzoquinol methylase
MLAINRARVSSPRVAYVLADLFSWHPDRLYDAVFVGFWLSHVPRERLDDFLRFCVAMLRPAGKVFFVDSRRPPNAPGAPHQATVPESQVVVRTLREGRAFEVVKNLYDATDLATRCTGAGFDSVVCQTALHQRCGLRKSLKSVPTRSRCAKHIVPNTDQERCTCLVPSK